MKKKKEIIHIYINSRTNEDYLDELWFNAREGGKIGTQLEWWNKENWKIAVKGWVESMWVQKNERN